MGEIDEPLCAHEEAVFHEVRIELEAIAARDPHNGHARAGRPCALDGARAAQRLIVRVRRNHEEHIGAAEAAEVGRRRARMRRAEDGAEQESAERASQSGVYRSQAIHEAVMRLKREKWLQ
jgi:hypothetical protein